MKHPELDKDNFEAFYKIKQMTIPERLAYLKGMIERSQTITMEEYTWYKLHTNDLQG